MTSILTQQISRLQLDHIPNLSAKAAQLFDQICRRIVHPKNKMLMLCRQCIAIQLACEGLSVEFNEVAASSISAVSLRSYQVCVQETKVALGLNKNITLEELDVQFGPPQLVIEYSRRLLDEFKQSLSATMSPAVSRVMDWANSVYIAAAFYLVCKHLKKRIVAKPKLIILASTKPSVFANAVAKLEQYGRNTLAEMDSGSVAAPRTPARKRARVDGEGNTKVGAASSGVSASANAAAPDPATRVPRSRRATIAVPAKTARSPAVEDEVGSVAVRRSTKVSQQVPSTEPRKAARTGRRSPPMPTRKPPSPVQATEGLQPRGRARTKGRAAATRSAKSESRAHPAKRPRIGVVSMIQDRDYRDSGLYADYQSWKQAILAAS